MTISSSASSRGNRFTRFPWDETLLAWHAKQDSGIKLYRIGGVVMVETSTVFDFIRRHPAPPLARKQAKAA